MKSVAGPLVAAIVLAVAGAGFWLLGKTETRIADMHKELAMLHYEEADSEGEAVEQGLGLERRMPVVGKAAEADVRDTRAVAGYWRADYEAIAPRKDANGVVTETNPAILFLTANAGFRASRGAKSAAHRPAARQRGQQNYGGSEAEAAAWPTNRSARRARWMRRSTSSSRFAPGTSRCGRGRCRQADAAGARRR